MRTREEMKTAAKLNFKRCAGVFVAAAAILFVLGGASGGTSASNNVRNSAEQNNISALTTQNDGLSTQENELLKQLVEDVSPAVVGIAVVVLLLLAALSLVISLGDAILSVGFSHMAMIASAGGTPKFRDFFAPFKRLGRWLGFVLMMGLRIILWSFLFIVPGIIAALRYSQATYLMLEDPDMGINDSLRKSGELMRGYKGKLFVLDLSFILWMLLIPVTFGLIALYLRPYMELTSVQFYYDLRRERPTEGLPPTMAFANVAEEPAVYSAPQPPVPPAPEQSSTDALV